MKASAIYVLVLLTILDVLFAALAVQYSGTHDLRVQKDKRFAFFLSLIFVCLLSLAVVFQVSLVRSLP